MRRKPDLHQRQLRAPGQRYNPVQYSVRHPVSDIGRRIVIVARHTGSRLLVLLPLLLGACSTPGDDEAAGKQSIGAGPGTPVKSNWRGDFSCTAHRDGKLQAITWRANPLPPGGRPANRVVHLRRSLQASEFGHVRWHAQRTEYAGRCNRSSLGWVAELHCRNDRQPSFDDRPDDVRNVATAGPLLHAGSERYLICNPSLCRAGVSRWSRPDRDPTSTWRDIFRFPAGGTVLLDPKPIPRSRGRAAPPDRLYRTT